MNLKITGCLPIEKRFFLDGQEITKVISYTTSQDVDTPWTEVTLTLHIDELEQLKEPTGSGSTEN